MSRGVVSKIGGIYLHPGLGNADVELALAPFVAYQILAADFNARHDRWAHVVDVGGHNQQWTVVARIQSGMDVMVQLVPTHDGISVIELCAFKLPPIKYCVSQLGGLPHAALIVKFEADTVGLPAAKPGYKRPRWDIVGSDLQSIDPSGDNILQEVRHVVDALPHTHHGKSSYHWWNNDLENIRNDVRQLRWATLRDCRRVHDYHLVRKIYCATIAQAQYQKMQQVLSLAKNLRILKYMHTLDTPRTLPAMNDGNGNMCRPHKNIGELITARLDPSRRWYRYRITVIIYGTLFQAMPRLEYSCAPPIWLHRSMACVTPSFGSGIVKPESLLCPALRMHCATVTRTGIMERFFSSVKPTT